VSDVRELLLTLQDDLGGVRFDAGAVRARGESRRRRRRALSAALAVVLVFAVLGTTRWAHLSSPPPPTQPAPRSDGQIHVSGSVRALALDPSTGTLYTADPGNPSGHDAASPEGLLVTATEHCNAGDTSACTVKSAPLDAVPWDLALSANGTLYVATWGTGVHLVDARTCNAADQSGCGTVRSGPEANFAVQGVAVDDTAHTLYAASLDDASSQDIPAFGSMPTSNHLPTSHVFVYDSATCNAGDSTGCGVRASLPLIGVVQAMTVDPASHTLYVVGQTSDGHRTLWATRGDAFTRVADLGVDSSMNLSATVGLALDQALHSLYVTPAQGSTVVVLDARRCTAGAPTCPAGTRAPVGGFPNSVAVDDATHTVYVLNGGDATISRFDGGPCNADDHTRCRSTTTALEPTGQPQSLQPSTLVLDPGTDTLYVAQQAANVVVPVRAAG
jgi:DNA-binding beta-propeller fold protein YncE